MALIVPSTVAQGGRFKFSGASGVRSAEGSRPSSLLSGANVAPQAVSTIRTPAPEPGKFDNTVLGTVSGVADQAGKVAVYVQNTIDEAVAKEADNKLADQIRNVIMNPESGYLTTNGKGALDSREATIEKLTKSQGNVSGILQNDMQRALFDRAARARINSALDRVDSHAMQQVKVYEQAESTARIQSTQIDAVNAWGSWNETDIEGNPHGSFNMHKNAMLGEISSYLEGQGFRPGTQEYNDAYKVTSTTELTKIHSNVIENMLSKNLPDNASAYYAAMKKKGEIDPSKYDQLEGILEVGSVNDESARLAIEISNLPFGEQVSVVTEKYNKNIIKVGVYDATLTRIKANKVLKNEVKAEKAEDYRTEINDYIINNPYGTIHDLSPALRQAAEENDDIARLQAFWASQRSKQGMSTETGEAMISDIMKLGSYTGPIYVRPGGLPESFTVYNNQEAASMNDAEWASYEAEKEALIKDKVVGPGTEEWENMPEEQKAEYIETTGRNYFKAFPVEMFREDLGSDYVEAINKHKRALIENDLTASELQPQVEEAIDYLKDNLVALGWDMTPDPGTSDAKNIVILKEALRRRILFKQSQAKGPISNEEVYDEANWLLKKGFYINQNKLGSKYDTLENYLIPDEARIFTRFSDMEDVEKSQAMRILEIEAVKNNRDLNQKPIRKVEIEDAWNTYLGQSGYRGDN
jgi:hypothetical protein